MRDIPKIGKILSYETLSYLFFGILSMIVNFILFFIIDKILGNERIASFQVFNNIFKITLEDVSTFISWIFTVLFVYVTNKLWVFESKAKETKTVLKEIASFFAARIVAFILFESLGYMLVRNVLLNSDYTTENFSKWTAKILMTIVVVVFNYIMSKLVIFKKKIVFDDTKTKTTKEN